MSCNYSRTKMKLVALATKSQGKHEQRFTHELCCAECGCKVVVPTEADVRKIMESYRYSKFVSVWDFQMLIRAVRELQIVEVTDSPEHYQLLSLWLKSLNK